MTEEKKLIQILGYRTGVSKETGKEYIWQELFPIKVSSVINMFKHLDQIIELIPEKERYNIHYTNANCHLAESKTRGLRKFAYQEIIVIDLDDIDMTCLQHYIDLVFEITKADKDKTGIFNSGHGLHFVIALDYRITEVKPLQKYYTALCNLISEQIFAIGLTGKADPIRLAESATLRLPNTLNKKEGLEDVMSSVIQMNIEPQPFDLEQLIGELPEAEVYEEGPALRAVDTQAVLSGCLFLQDSLSNAATISEPEWYAMIGVLAFIPEIGRELCHTYSRGHSGYDFDATEAKINQALGLGKPRRCASIEQVYSKCNQCAFYRTCRTPLSIKGEDFIGTETSGFHDIFLDKMGNPKRFVPNYQDLVSFFKKKHTFVTSRETTILHKFNGKYWEQVERSVISAFATTHFKPVATNTMREEFNGLLKSTNVVDEGFFTGSTEGFINFNNGILKLDSRILLPHSKEYGFQYCLPYDYDPHAMAPHFEKMMESVTIGDKQLQNVLLEFMAYSISNIDPSWGEKALILDGNGSNGKSTFLDVLRNLVGDNCYSSVPLNELKSATSRQATVGKLFNLSEETEINALRESSMFRALVTGASITFRKLYHQEATMKFRAKIIVACNKIPPTNDDSNGTYRRMLIVPFRNIYSKKNGNLDKDIRKKIYAEMSGVYNLVLDAYDRLIEQKGFTEASASEEALNAYKQEVDVIAQFMESEIEVTNNELDFIPCNLLFEVFKGWGERTNSRHAKDMSMIIFSRKIKQHLGIRDTAVKKVANKSVRGFEGIVALEEFHL